MANECYIIDFTKIFSPQVGGITEDIQ